MNEQAAPVVLVPNDYKSDVKPVWCPGCGDFGVLNAMAKAMAKLALRPEEVAVVSGIGCSSRIPAYTSCYGFHGVHGRALPTGTGLKAWLFAAIKMSVPQFLAQMRKIKSVHMAGGTRHLLEISKRNRDLLAAVGAPLPE